MLDAAEYFTDVKEEKQDNERFSFKYFAKKVIERQKNDKDTIIVVIGERRNGKSNWALNLVKQFMVQKKQQGPFKWNWRDNFPITRSQAMEKAEAVADESFIFYDEGADFMYRGDTLSFMNKMLIKFMSKTGKKRLLTIIVLPDIFLLDPKILNMAHFLVAVPYRYESVCSFAFIYSRNPNPFVQDKFGLEAIKRQFAGKKVKKSLRSSAMRGSMKTMIEGRIEYIPYPRDLFAFMRGLPTYIHWHRFHSVAKDFEDKYIKNVKNKQLAAKDEVAFVKQGDFNRLYARYTTLVHSLRMREDMTYALINRLHVDNAGNFLTNVTAIKNIIDSVAGKYNAGDVSKVRDDA